MNKAALARLPVLVKLRPATEKPVARERVLVFTCEAFRCGKWLNDDLWIVEGTMVSDASIAGWIPMPIVEG